MNDLVVSPSTSMLSIRCSSSAVPNVTDASAWVSPRWNSAEPWARGSRPTSMLIGRMVSRSRPSTRSPLSNTWARMARYSSSSTSAAMSFRLSGNSAASCSSTAWRSSFTLAARPTFALAPDELLDALLRHLERLQQFGLRYLERAPLHHVESLGRAAHDQVEAGDLELLERRVQ